MNGGTITVSLPAAAPDVAPSDVEVVILDQHAAQVTPTVTWTKVTSGSPRPDCPTLPVWQGTFTQPDNWRVASVRLTTPEFTTPDQTETITCGSAEWSECGTKTSSTDYSSSTKTGNMTYNEETGEMEVRTETFTAEGTTVASQTISATDHNESFTRPTPRSVPRVDPATAAAGAERRQRAEEAEQVAASKPLWWCSYDADAGAAVIHTTEGVKWAAATPEQAAEGGCE